MNKAYAYPEQIACCTRNDKFGMPILALHEELTLRDCAQLSEFAIGIAREGHRRIALDMAAVQRLESAGAYVLSQLAGQLARYGCDLRFFDESFDVRLALQTAAGRLQVVVATQLAA